MMPQSGVVLARQGRICMVQLGDRYALYLEEEENMRACAFLSGRDVDDLAGVCWKVKHGAGNVKNHRA
jgi:hypothetical protein